LHCGSGVCLLLLICSESHPDDDPIVSKHVAVWMFYKVVLDGYFFTPLFTVQLKGMHNFKITLCKIRRSLSFAREDSSFLDYVRIVVPPWVQGSSVRVWTALKRGTSGSSKTFLSLYRHHGVVHQKIGMFWLLVLDQEYLAFALQLGKKHGKTSVRVAEECQL